jgi:hypothetical protein
VLSSLVRYAVRVHRPSERRSRSRTGCEASIDRTTHDATTTHDSDTVEAPTRQARPSVRRSCEWVDQRDHDALSSVAPHATGPRVCTPRYRPHVAAQRRCTMSVSGQTEAGAADHELSMTRLARLSVLEPDSHVTSAISSVVQRLISARARCSPRARHAPQPIQHKDAESADAQMSAHAVRAPSVVERC